jgi:hypothetical protein
VGPWVGSIAVGDLGATATATGPITAAGLQLGALASVHLAAGKVDLKVSAGAVLLVAEGR